LRSNSTFSWEEPYRANNKDRLETSNACIYKGIKYEINQPH
jgi:hypothetical protein